MGKKRSVPQPGPPAGPFHDAFAKLRERLPEGWTPPAPADAGHSPLQANRGERSGASGEAGHSPLHAKRGEGSGEGPPRAVVRIERKGRGGKEATLVEKLDLSPATLSAWLDEAKRSLGCGGTVEDGALVLQGDQRERVARWLEKRGVRKVTVGT